LALLGGCAGRDYLSEGETEFEAKMLLEDASSLEADRAVKNPLPEIYAQSPRVIHTSNGVKVLYFAKNQPPNVLAGMLGAQMKTGAAEANATNQLIINCGSDEEAQEVISFLDYVDVLPVQIKVSCMMIEHYADFTMDRETTAELGSLLGTDITLEAKRVDGVIQPTFLGASLREPARSKIGINIGVNNVGSTQAVVDMLESRGYLKIMMNPELEVISGERATFKSREQVPTVKTISFRSGNTTDTYELVEYIWVEDYLDVVPKLYADGTIGITTKVTMGSKSTPEGVVQQRIISNKNIDIGENRVRPGQSLIVGGFKKATNVAIVRGYPILKDIPIFGFLFSSKDFEERAKEVTFIITPSISTYGRPYDEVLEEVRKKRAEQVTDTELLQIIDRMVIDPFGKGKYESNMRNQRDSEEIKKIKAEIALSKSSEEIKRLQKELEQIKQRLELEKQDISESEQSVESYKKEIKKVEQLSATLEAAIETGVGQSGEAAK
jgi:type II secretory pathway component GspD/PulD (secretin)